MRKLALGLTLLLLLSTVGIPASARPKKTKYQTFTHEGETLVAGVTTISWSEFQFTCPEPPISQGVSGYLIELPDAFTTGTATAAVNGAGVLGVLPDFSISIWSRDCEQLVNTQPAPQLVPPGGVFVMVESDFDFGTTFTFTATAPVPRR
ncbi:MAG TPA: hypothetical protein VHJ82_00130 [Actinomycetota bacterium]|nr:hypothetical protein [Actinomycetota bacterium]